MYTSTNVHKTHTIFVFFWFFNLFLFLFLYEKQNKAKNKKNNNNNKNMLNNIKAWKKDANAWRTREKKTKELEAFTIKRFGK